MFGVGHAAPEQEFNMILTVTMNPSIDTRYQLDKLIIDDVNRVTPEKTAGGKGLNVSRVLLQLGDDVLATGLLGGHMGAYMAELMDADGVKNDFVPIAGETRICLNILHEAIRPSFWRAARRSLLPSSRPLRPSLPSLQRRRTL